MTKDEALKLALEALEELVDLMNDIQHENYKPDSFTTQPANNAITAIKEALAQQNQTTNYSANYSAQPEQEPVAAQCKFDTEKTWGPCSVEHHHLVQSEHEKWPQYQTRLLYTTPPQRKPLTDEEIGSCIDEVNLTSQYGHHHFGWHKQFARAIEAAHGIKGEA